MPSTPLIEPRDLQVFDPSLDDEKASEMILDILAETHRIAPCLEPIEDDKIRASAKAIIRRALLRWAEQGTGVLQQWSNTDGPFTRAGSMDTRMAGSINFFYPSEEDALRGLCAPAKRRRAGSRWLV